MKNLWIWQIPEEQLNINEETDDEEYVQVIFQ